MQTDLNDIRVFVTVARFGTFSAAAKDLKIPTSTVSRSITRLERSLGSLLYQRSPKGLHLTDAGQEYLSVCKRALRSLREGRDRLEHHRLRPSGSIRIACPITMARDMLAPILVHFLAAHPELRVVLEHYCANFDQEPREDVDIFFKLKAPRDSNRRVRNFASTLRALYASTAYLEAFGKPATPMDLVKHRCVGAGTWSLRKDGETANPQIQFQIQTSDPAVLVQLAGAGVGIAMLPRWMAVREERLVRILPKWEVEPVTVCALYHGPSTVTPKVRVFLEFLEKYFGTAEDPRLSGRKVAELFSKP